MCLRRAAPRLVVCCRGRRLAMAVRMAGPDRLARSSRMTTTALTPPGSQTAPAPARLGPGPAGSAALGRWRVPSTVRFLPVPSGPWLAASGLQPRSSRHDAQPARRSAPSPLLSRNPGHVAAPGFCWRSGALRAKAAWSGGSCQPSVLPRAGRAISSRFQESSLADLVQSRHNHLEEIPTVIQYISILADQAAVVAGVWLYTSSLLDGQQRHWSCCRPTGSGDRTG